MNSLHSVTEIGSLVVAGGGAIATFVVTRQALDRHSPFGSPTLLAICLASIAFFAILSLGPVVLIPYAALGLASLAWPAVRFWRSQGLFQPRRPTEDAPTQPTETNLLTTPTRTRRTSPPAEPRTIPALRPTKPPGSKPVIPLDIRDPATTPTKNRRQRRQK